jgi:2Fe-2S ferredoxin
MRASVDNRLPGIRGACGGAAACGTCHVYVHEPWASMLPPCGPEEAYMLDNVWDVRSNSRLACQILLNEGLDGITVDLPGRQG